MKKRRGIIYLFILSLLGAAFTACLSLLVPAGVYASTTPCVAPGLVNINVEGTTDLPGNFFLSFVYSRNIIMLDGKGNIVWSKHEDPIGQTGLWDFKKHDVNGETYYSYHDQTGKYDNYGMEGFAPGERVILDKDFNEVKRITFESSDVTEKGHPLDGHDFLLIDLDHYILSGYIKDTVKNVPDYPEGSSLIYSYLQEVKDGKVVWDWKSVDYPELYSLTSPDEKDSAGDFANLITDIPDYIHFNAMRLDADGDLVCSFKNLNTILCLDRKKKDDQIKWFLSGKKDEFGLSESQKTSGQHYVVPDRDYITVFNNDSKGKSTSVMAYRIDKDKKKLKAFRSYALGNKYSRVCGSAQNIRDDLFVIGWGGATRDLECMSVVDFSTGEKLMSVSLDEPFDFTYRCVYYE